MITEVHVFDTETTGLDHPIKVLELTHLRVIEIIPGKEYAKEDVYTRLVDPKRPINPEASEKHGIYQADIDREKPPEIHELDFPPGEIIFVSHNVPFDYPLLHEHINTVDTLCTLQLARRMVPEAPTHRLEDLVDYLKLGQSPNHFSEKDSFSCADLLIYFLCFTKWSLQQMYDFMKTDWLHDIMVWGKHKGRPMGEVPVGYLLWLNELKDLDRDMAYTVNHYLKKRGLR